jgi:hypothetical protein
MFESFVFSKTIEGYDFKPDAQVGTKDFSNNIAALQEKSDLINSSDLVIDTNYNNLKTESKRLSHEYNNTYNTYKKLKYDKIEIPDKTDLIQTTRDVREQDIHNIMLQQNYIYIVGSITCATLLIAAIIIGKD